MNAMDAYHTLEARFRRRHAVADALAMLYWDRSTMMPAGAADARTDQIAELTKIAREILVAPETAEALDRAEEGRAGLDAWQDRNLSLMRRAWVNETAVPGDLVEAVQRAGAKSEMVWREAKPANDFARQKPHLEEVIRLAREMAGVRGSALGLDPYDAQLDQFEPGLREADIAPVFADLESWLPDMVGRILEAEAARPPAVRPTGPFATPAQKRLGERFMAALGFDFSRGRLDESAHPFTGGIPDDSRLTTRYSDGSFVEALMGILHETGHALYEQGLPRNWRSQPVGQSGGMALHESQSLIVEMQLCRGPAFLDHALPLIRGAFGDDPAFDPDNMRRLVGRVRRGLIRVDADEATYPLHVILRHRLEKALLSGDLAVADLPGAWNDTMQDLVGIRPETDREGCLQDIHWMDGAIGYFPTYTLGALAAAQLMAALRRDIPDLDDRIRAGDFTGFVGWLRRNVHEKGLSQTTGAVVEAASGAPLSTAAFRAHLQSRYLN